MSSRPCYRGAGCSRVGVRPLADEALWVNRKETRFIQSPLSAFYIAKHRLNAPHTPGPVGPALRALPAQQAGRGVAGAGGCRGDFKAAARRCGLAFPQPAGGDGAAAAALAAALSLQVPAGAMSVNGGSQPRLNTLGRMARADSGTDVRYDLSAHVLAGGGGGGGGGGGHTHSHTHKTYYYKSYGGDVAMDGYG